MNPDILNPQSLHSKTKNWISLIALKRNRGDIRRINKIFGFVFFLEIVLLSFFLYLSYYRIIDESERIKNIASIIASFMAALLTTSLVYYNFYQMPELAFTGFLVEPINERSSHHICAEEEYIEQVGGGKQVKNDKYSRKFPTWVKIVKCSEEPTFLRVRNDVTNLGLHETNIHEIRFYLTYPNQTLLYTLPKRIMLAHQTRETIEWLYPSSDQLAKGDSLKNELWLHKSWKTQDEWNDIKKSIRYQLPNGTCLKEGIYRLKFEVIGATVKYSKEVWIRISEDLKTVEWSESRFKILTRF